MKFLIKKEWERILSKLSFNRKSLKETAEEKLFFEISQRIKELTQQKCWTHKTYGIAMTFFHYYICFNNIRNIDIIELCFACLYMSSKIQFFNISLKEFINDYKNYLKKKKLLKKIQILILLNMKYNYILNLDTILILRLHFSFFMIIFI